MDRRQRLARITVGLTSIFGLASLFLLLIGMRMRQSRRRRCRLNARAPYRIRGDWFMRDVVNGSDYLCLRMTRMRKPMFFRFANLMSSRGLLTETIHMTVEEQVAMELYILGHHSRIVTLVTLFQRSGETISRYFHLFLEAVTTLSEEFITLPPTTVPEKIANSATYYPWFVDCIGSIDGTHIEASVPIALQAPFRGRKGITQNILAACDFNIRFVFVEVGWEGSANDITILKDALSRENGFKVPEGKYYLADAGYTTMPGFIAPYRGCRYHLKDYDRHNGPRDCRELFNLRHATLRNTIERAFGVLKRRFRMLTTKSGYPFSSQVTCVIACCVVHNFLMDVDPEGDDFFHQDTENFNVDDVNFEEYSQNLGVRERREQNQPWVSKRDQIAADMWAAYSHEMEF